MAYWSIEETAEHLGLTVTQIRESRRKGEWPGNVGKLRGRRLAFNADLIEAGPQTAESTTDPLEAILWTLQGIEAKLTKMLAELTRQRSVYATGTVVGQYVPGGNYDWGWCDAYDVTYRAGNTYVLTELPTTTTGDEEE